MARKIFKLTQMVFCKVMKILIINKNISIQTAENNSRPINDFYRKLLCLKHYFPNCAKLSKLSGKEK